uniref:Uncharacterized protein n=1 Tax=Rhizophora mucronata TaxID=61149 RepID=A0A2P2QGS7_RHIMU
MNLLMNINMGASGHNILTQRSR